MLIGRVIGTVVASRKEPSMSGLKFLVVRQLDVEGKETNSYVVAVDAVGAGVGEVVMFATGSSARQTEVTDKRESKSRPGEGIVTFAHTGRNQHGDVVATASRKTMVRKKPEE